ncbi:TetR/AcrR family transcriptional regulator [Tsukamurella sp. 1534]|uniref:TetR/AcrR family transcriptional regulator n=1 Tax=Tsukamurella sp. 1534 TaxID=1151061 RepID=UPI0002D53574|nr:TetR/AcrR family transcriptional regulator [Tsukamurella sp. 1534]
MDQPRSFIEEARRRQIIAAAVEVLADEGYGRATLARIARHAGISKGVISYHFAGKDELMREVVVQLFVSGGEFMAPLLAEARSSTDTLRTYIAGNLEYLKTNRRFLAAMIEVVVNLRDPDGTLAFGPDDGEKAMVAPLLDILRAGQEAGEFGEFDPLIMAHLIRDSIDGAAGHAARNPEHDLDAHAEQMVRVYLSAVKTAPPSSENAPGPEDHDD